MSSLCMAPGRCKRQASQIAALQRASGASHDNSIGQLPSKRIPRAAMHLRLRQQATPNRLLAKLTPREPASQLRTQCFAPRLSHNPNILIGRGPSRPPPPPSRFHVASSLLPPIPPSPM
eukprot:2626325-Pyramimonas_sp.AAC.1